MAAQFRDVAVSVFLTGSDDPDVDGLRNGSHAQMSFTRSS
jgi:hypothetical protein